MSGSPDLSPLLQVDDLSRTFHTGGGDVQALRHVSVSVRAGQLVAMTGRSGSGKTTLLNLVAGLDTPDGGRVRIGDRMVGELTPKELVEMRRTTIGFVFQSFGLLPILTAAENVGVPLRLLRTERAAREERVRVLLRLVGLDQQANQRPLELSGGQQQRVAVARALANRPALLLADEPTGQLDSHTGRGVMELLRAVVTSEGVAALVTTHDPGLLGMADEVHELRDGQVVDPAVAAG